MIHPFLVIEMDDVMNHHRGKRRCGTGAISGASDPHRWHAADDGWRERWSEVTDPRNGPEWMVVKPWWNRGHGGVPNKLAGWFIFWNSPKKVDDDWGLVPMTKRTPHIDTYRMAIKSQDMAMANQIEHQIKKTNRIQWNKNTTHEFYFWDVLAGGEL